MPLILTEEHEDGSDGDIQFRARAQAYWKRHPNLIAKLMPTIRETRTILRNTGLPRPDDTPLRDMPFIVLEHDDWGAHIDVVAHKLMLGLHYRFWGKPLPISGRIWFHTNSNVELAAGQIDENIEEIWSFLQEDVKVRESTNGQLCFWMRKGDKADFAAYAVLLQQKLLITGASIIDPTGMKSETNGYLLAPFI